MTSTFVPRGILRGRRGTWRHPPVCCVAGVAPICHTQLCHTPFFTTPSFTHNFVTHHFSPHHLPHTTLTHHLSHTTLSHTPSFFVTRHLSHTAVSHTTFFNSRSSTTSFVFPSFPVLATTFVAHYWKKLTCGVIRSFHLSWQMRLKGRATSQRECGQKTIPKFCRS